MSVVVCTDLSGKEPHRQVGVGMVGISGSLGGVMISTLAWNAKCCAFDYCSRRNVSHIVINPQQVMLTVTATDVQFSI